MLKCWQVERKERPKFPTLREALLNHLSSCADHPEFQNLVKLNPEKSSALHSIVDDYQKRDEKPSKNFRTRPSRRYSRKPTVEADEYQYQADYISIGGNLSKANFTLDKLHSLKNGHIFLNNLHKHITCNKCLS